jgi:hypothetical protein
VVFYGTPTFLVTGSVTVAFVEAFALFFFGSGCVATVAASVGFWSRTERRRAGSTIVSSSGGDFLFAIVI